VYLMQKSHYNNHYYLLVIFSWVMFMLPAHKGYSLDVKWGLTIAKKTCARICHWYFILNVAIVYLFASFNKMHADWTMARPISVWFTSKADYWLIGPLLQQEWFQYFIAWGGIVYDGTIVFLLLHPRTRKIGFVLSLFFNLANSAIFQIGIFPYLMIGLCVFFFPPETIRKIFFKRKDKVYPVKKQLSSIWTTLLALYLVVNLCLPFRHFFYEGNASWTEEGHRLSWRMMLRVKQGYCDFYVQDSRVGKRLKIKMSDWVSNRQYRSMISHPDMIWQLAQKIKEEYAREGKQVSVFVKSSVSLNGGPRLPLVGPDVDLASVEWERFKHADWILTYDIHD